MDANESLSDLPPLTYACRVNCVTGYGGAGRHQIWALRRAGARLSIQDVGSVGDPDPKKQSSFIQTCRRSDSRTGVSRGSIIHLGPNMTPEWRRRLPKPHILVSVWETTRLPASWVPIINSFDQVWCATEWQLDVYAASGVDKTKLVVVPFVLDPSLYDLNGPLLPEVDALRRQGRHVFGSMFQWTERKAPQALLGAYLSTFRSGEPVSLVLKTYEGDDPSNSVQAKVTQLCDLYRSEGPRPHVEIVSRKFTHDETLAFYRSIDTYVSSHRGEGFGLPLAEAMLMRRPVIATDWSAPTEWGRGCYAPVAYDLEAPHSMGWQPFYTTDQRWAAPSQRALGLLMEMANQNALPPAPRERVLTAPFTDQRAFARAARTALKKVLR